MPQQATPLFNKYFDLYPKAGRSNETELIEDLLEEVIIMHAAPVYYIVRESQDQVDLLFGEDPVKKFKRSFLMPMYINKVDGFTGDSEFFTKFGLEVRDSTSLIISRRTFKKVMPTNLAIVPREGDLIFIPVFDKLFEIKFVNEEYNFGTLGKSFKESYVYELSVETFRYSQEVLETGVDDIDAVRQELAYAISLHLSAGSGNYISGEIVYQGGSNVNTSFASAEVKSWNAPTNTLIVYPPKGEFQESINVSGSVSNTIRLLSSFDELDIANTETFTVSDGEELQIEGNQVINFNEVNPFGSPD